MPCCNSLVDMHRGGLLSVYKLTQEKSTLRNTEFRYKPEQAGAYGTLSKVAAIMFSPLHPLIDLQAIHSSLPQRRRIIMVWGFFVFYYKKYS